MHLKWDWSSTINSTEIEFCGGGFDTHLSIFYKEVELGASFLSNVVAGNAASVKAIRGEGKGSREGRERYCAVDESGGVDSKTKGPCSQANYGYGCPRRNQI